ncbi:hypothetical protein [Actinophytocola glycyrrhizae]|uniref:Uncharacterized protein n=1 Tax=Actinophytocola glycyrrhizae TaxID=2044873 RepID=A0ABV9RTS2_9PSEU
MTVGTARGSRPHDPLLPDDVTAATGCPVLEVIRENEGSEDAPDAALTDGSWALTFDLGSGRYLSCYANRFPVARFTVQDDLDAWTAEAEFAPVDGVGDQAVILTDDTIWFRVGQEWAVQILASPDLPRSARLAAAGAAARRLAGA